MIVYRTDPLSEDEIKDLELLFRFQDITGHTHTVMAMSILLARLDTSKFEAIDMVKLLSLTEREFAREISACIHAAPCFCTNPDCERRKAASAKPADPLDTPAKPGESVYAETLGKLSW